MPILAANFLSLQEKSFFLLGAQFLGLPAASPTYTHWDLSTCSGKHRAFHLNVVVVNDYHILYQVSFSTFNIDLQKPPIVIKLIIVIRCYKHTPDSSWPRSRRLKLQVVLHKLGNVYGQLRMIKYMNSLYGNLL